jgi:hypothetical protein
VEGWTVEWWRIDKEWVREIRIKAGEKREKTIASNKQLVGIRQESVWRRE